MIGGVTVSNPTKVFWPEDGLTKLDLVRFYARISPAILPWLKDRALTLERCPEGLRQSCFFQKQAPAHLGSAVPTVRIPAPSAGRTIDYVVGGTRKTLLTLVNLGCIAMHTMNCRVDQLDHPDWLIFDLDPAADYGDAARAALLLNRQLEEHGLESFVKTSGARGLHVFVPLRRGPEQDRVRTYARLIAQTLASLEPGLVTLQARKRDRRAPVYVDIGRNAAGQTIVPPYSVRWRRGAPVSMPLAWDEVSARLKPSAFTVKTAEKRMALRDPWAGFFRKRQTLPRA
jgi:bifunctional non-homologous end joining protein LigD